MGSITLISYSLNIQIKVPLDFLVRIGKEKACGADTEESTIQHHGQRIDAVRGADSFQAVSGSVTSWDNFPSLQEFPLYANKTWEKVFPTLSRRNL